MELNRASRSSPCASPPVFAERLFSADLLANGCDITLFVAGAIGGPVSNHLVLVVYPAPAGLISPRQNPQGAGPAHGYIPPGYMAWAYSMAGEKEKSFALLEKAYQQHDPALANLKVDSGFDALRDDPRFNDLLKKVGFSN